MEKEKSGFFSEKSRTILIASLLLSLLIMNVFMFVTFISKDKNEDKNKVDKGLGAEIHLPSTEDIVSEERKNLLPTPTGDMVKVQDGVLPAKVMDVYHYPKNINIITPDTSKNLPAIFCTIGQDEKATSIELNDEEYEYSRCVIVKTNKDRKINLCFKHENTEN